jgi:hypothetical protein
MFMVSIVFLSLFPSSSMVFFFFIQIIVAIFISTSYHIHATCFPLQLTFTIVTMFVSLSSSPSHHYFQTLAHVVIKVSITKLSHVSLYTIQLHSLETYMDAYYVANLSYSKLHNTKYSTSNFESLPYLINQEISL